MALTKKALQAINNPKTRIKLAIALEVAEQTIFLYIKRNSDNLTKVKAIEVIQQETGLKIDEILEKADNLLS
jgi:hypothetical protein